MLKSSCGTDAAENRVIERILVSIFHLRNLKKGCESQTNQTCFWNSLEYYGRQSVTD